jgi:hypothetical protein
MHYIFNADLPNPLRLVPTRMPPRPIDRLWAYLPAFVSLPEAADYTNYSMNASGISLSTLLHASLVPRCRARKVTGPTLPSLTAV